MNATQESLKNQVINELIKAHYYEFVEVVVSPVDDELLIVMGNKDVPHESYAIDYCNRTIWRHNLKSGKTTQLTLMKEDASNPTWSPDGSCFAYICNKNGKKDIWIRGCNDSSKRRLTNSSFPGLDPFNGTSICWSPDGKYIAFSVVPNGSWNGLFNNIKMSLSNPQKIMAYKSEEDIRKKLKVAISKTYEGALYFVNVNTGECNQILSIKNECFQIINWFDDNERLLIKIGSEIQEVTINTGDIKQIYSGKSTLIKLHDSKILLATRTNSTVKIGEIKEGKFNISCEIELPGYEPIHLHNWSCDATKVIFTAQHGVSNVLYSIEISDHNIKRLTEFNKVVWSYHHRVAPKFFNTSNAIIFPYGDSETPAQLTLLNKNDELKTITNFNMKIKLKNKVKIIKYKSDCFEIESLLILPPNYKSSVKYPTLIYLHGGPEYCVSSCFSELISARAHSAAHFLASQGYIVFIPNFRGSSGYGTELLYEISNYKLMQNPYKDIITGIDYLVDNGIADPEKLGIYGCSYGAWLTAWTISQTSRFKGAVGSVGFYEILQQDRRVGVPLYSLMENRSENTNPQDTWLRSEIYKEFSPIDHLSSINTPIMFIETSAERQIIGSHATPLLNGLYARGIESTLVYYPEAFHNGGWNDYYKTDYMNRLISWFDHCIKGEPLPSWFNE